MAKAYTEAQRAMAIEILNRHGGELNKRAIAEIRKILGQPDLPKVTIWRWLQRDVTAQKNATPEAKAAAAEKVAGASLQCLNHLGTDLREVLGVST